MWYSLERVYVAGVGPTARENGICYLRKLLQFNDPDRISPMGKKDFL
jgi:hypothetical protein